MAALALAAAAEAAPRVDDAAMDRLAARGGCLACHSIESGRRGPAGLDPIAPAWQDVAARYRGDPQAAQRLVQAVLQGTRADGAHWSGEVSGMAMPPSAPALGEGDVRRLIAWILARPPH
ncbi:MAG: c-type cytochrome [Ideonella sp.]|nr:c-type cytochrome [Ideonella sp.]